MRAVIVAGFVAFVISLLGTPPVARFFRALKAGQPIREIGPQTHLTKRGTPTMGGVVFILATVIAYVVGHLVMLTLPASTSRPGNVTVTGVVLLGLFVFCGLVGFLDDFLKVRKKNSLGLNKRGKLVGQLLVGAVFGAIAVNFPTPDKWGYTVMSDHLSFVRDISWLHIGKIAAVVIFVLVVMSASNAVNLTDGLDGLATGTSIMVLSAYGVIAFWQYRHWCPDYPTAGHYCYSTRDPLEIALVAIAAAGALVGFLWWNTSPAKIFMGDSGALGLGGLIGGLAMATQTILLLLILGGLFVIITMSVVIQVISFRTTGRRVFRMSPLQHHFELKGWSEVNIVVRFWIIAGLCVAVAIGLFYGDFLRAVG